MIVSTIVWGAPEWTAVAVTSAVLGIVLLGWTYARSGAPLLLSFVAATLKLLGIGILAICLAEPLFSGVRPRPGANLFAILVDNSRSMALRGRRSGEQLQRVLRDKSAWRTRLDQDFEVRTYTFDEQLHNVASFADLEFTGLSSTLGGSLELITKRLQHQPLAGVFLFTDGNATDLQRSDLDQTAPPVPVYPVVDELEPMWRDIRIETVQLSQTNFETTPVTLNVEIASTGFAGQMLVAQLRDESGKLVKEFKATATEADKDAGRTTGFSFRFRPESSGIGFYTVQAFAEQDRSAFRQSETGREATWENNHRVVAVERTRGPHRVLYVAGRPNWDFKFLRRAVQEDDEVHIVGLIRLAKEEPKFSFRDFGNVGDRNKFFEGFDGKDDEDAESYDQPVLVPFGVEDEKELSGGFPKVVDELFAYDAIMLDDVEARFFTHDQMLLIRRFVSERGGGLMMLGGADAYSEGGYDRTPLGELLPVYADQSRQAHQDGPYRLRLTRDGLLQPWVRTRATEDAELQRLQQLPPLWVLNQVNGIKPGASQLAEVDRDDQALPALVTQRFGKGRTAALLVADLWRWAMRAEDDQANDVPQLWRQIVRWLVADVPKRVEANVEYDGVTSATVQVQVRDAEFKPLDNATVQLTVTDPAGQQVQISAEASDRAGWYLARLQSDQDGGYRVQIGVTGPDDAEVGSCTTGWASQPAAAEQRSVAPDLRLLEALAARSGGEIIPSDQLPQFVRELPNRKVPISETWTYPLWHQPWVFALAMACLCGEWGLRRWKGLP